jgi:hypothetical protein
MILMPSDAEQTEVAIVFTPEFKRNLRQLAGNIATSSQMCNRFWMNSPKAIHRASELLASNIQSLKYA